MWRLLPFTLKSPTTLSPWARLNLLEIFYHLVAAEYGRGLQWLAGRPGIFFVQYFFFPVLVRVPFFLVRSSGKRSRILPCGKGPHFYLVYISLPWIHFCLVRSKVYHLYLLSWPFVKGARKSFSHRRHSFSVVSFHFSPDTHFPYGWGFDCCHADAINRRCVALDKKMSLTLVGHTIIKLVRVTQQLPLQFTIFNITTELRTPSGVMGSLGLLGLLSFVRVSHHQANIPQDLGLPVGQYDRWRLQSDRPGAQTGSSTAATSAASSACFLPLFAACQLRPRLSSSPGSWRPRLTSQAQPLQQGQQSQPSQAQPTACPG